MAEKEYKISFWVSHLTLMVSVTFVLLLVGLISSVWIVVNGETAKLKERVEISVLMADSITDRQALKTAREIAQFPYSKHTELISKAQAMELWKQQTGEDLESLYGLNPLSPEIEFTLNGKYCNSEDIVKIKEQLKGLVGVESVDAPETELISSINANLENITWILVLLAVVMSVITIVLINNTVHLTIYSKRFTIHTMQLVGATNSYICRPIVFGDALCGLIAGISATLLTFAIEYAFLKYQPGIFAEETVYTALAVNAIVLTFLGMFLCALTSWVATSRYLRKDYDKLFK